MRCLTCQYDLRNLTKHRCPECGREFDGNDPSSFGSDHRKPFVVQLITTVAALGILVAVFIGTRHSFLYPLEPGERYSWQSLMASVMALGATFLAFFVLTMLYLAYRTIRQTVTLLRGNFDRRVR